MSYFQLNDIQIDRASPLAPFDLYVSFNIGLAAEEAAKLSIPDLERVLRAAMAQYVAREVPSVVPPLRRVALLLED